jgi:DNA topoisomerase-1
LSLPREVGPHPETGEIITAGLGRYGPYLRMGATYISLKDDDVLDVGLNRAVALFADAPQKKSSAKTLGDHPSDGKPVTIRSGRYGPYVQHGTLRASLPAGVDAETLDLDRAVAILQEKSAQSPAKGRGEKPTAKKTAAKKTPAKKSSGKKPGAKKTRAAG